MADLLFVWSAIVVGVIVMKHFDWWPLVGAVLALAVVGIYVWVVSDDVIYEYVLFSARILGFVLFGAVILGSVALTILSIFKR